MAAEETDPALWRINPAQTPAPGGEQKPVGDGLRPQLAMMAQAFMASAQRRTLFMLGAAIVVVVGATAYGQIRLNAWNKPFYDALARKDLRRISLPASRFRGHRRRTAGS